MAAISGWRQGRAAGLGSGSLALSLGIHIALVALVLFVVGGPRPSAPPVLTVSLVAPAPLPPGPAKEGLRAGGPLAVATTPGPPAAQPKKRPVLPAPSLKKARPKPAPTRPRPEPETVAPALLPRPAPPPRVAAPASPAAAARPAAPAPSAAGSSGSSAGASGPAGGTAQTGSGSGAVGRGAPGSGSGAGSGPGGGGSAAVGIQRHYLNLIRARILAKRSYPLQARQQRQEGIVRLRFTLSAGGSLAQDVQVVKPSGFQLLDDQARHCVRAAAPFPPLPRELQRSSLTVELPIVYKITEVGT
jgi:periplasmic protein TonB